MTQKASTRSDRILEFGMGGLLTVYTNIEIIMVANTYRLYFLVIVLVASGSIAFAQRVKMPMNTQVLEGTFWSMSIQDAATGEELVGVRSHHLMTPASTMKVVSTATAMSINPTEMCFNTTIATDGSISGDTLRGNLYIIGEGDPSIGSRYFWNEDRDKFFKEVVNALKAKGVRRVTGGVMALSDQRDFQAENPRWPFYDLGNHYAAGIYGLNLFDNAYTVQFDDFGHSFKTDPEIPGLKLSKMYERTSTRSRDSLYIARVPMPDGSFPITGVYPAKVQTLKIRGAILNPPLFMAQYLGQQLSLYGITCGSNPSLVQSVPQSLETLHIFRSPSLRDLVSVTNIYSHNLFAEGMLLLVGRNKLPQPGHNASQTAIMELMRYWQGRGLDVRELEMVDGSGLSAENKVSAYFLAALLGKVYRADPSGVFMRTLPKAGREGTVSGFLKRTPLEGRAYLKSGSIRNVVCYTGYVQLDGKTYTLAIMVNNFYGKAANIRSGMEGILLESFGLK